MTEDEGSDDAKDMLDAIDRMVLEIEAMDAICNADYLDESENDGIKDFVVVTHQALEQAGSCVDEATASNAPSHIVIEAFVRTSESRDQNAGVRLRMTLPLGYPTKHCASVTVLQTPKFVNRVRHDVLSTKLQSTANELIGSEAMISIISECRDLVSDWECCNSGEIGGKEEEEEEVVGDNEATATSSPTTICRRWIWVHHITNNDRRKQIVIEARERNLGGYLKAGYPGVVVIEGISNDCDEFVVWIKGNKSRPGGFGRQWGHHVRGEATAEQRQLPAIFKELDDDMGLLGSLCREFEVEDEFREFVLQQK